MASESSATRPSRAQVAATLRRVYAQAPFKQRLMAAGRPWIAPLEEVLAEIPPSSRHLDIGCGAGFLLSLSTSLRNAGPARGVDVDEKTLQIARQVLGNATNADVRVFTDKDWARMPDGDFDVVTLVDVLHHVPWTAREDFLRALIARLRPGGLFVYKDIAQRPRWRAIANYMHDLILTGERVRLSPVADVERMVAANGCRLEKSADMYRMWYAHQLRVFRK